MRLVDTSIWVDHLRAGNDELRAALDAWSVVTHPHVIGEIELGSLRNRAEVLALLEGLPRASVAADHEVTVFVESHRLFGRGIGYVDAHLLAATALTERCTLWTRDKRLDAVARELGLRASRQ